MYKYSSTVEFPKIAVLIILFLFILPSIASNGSLLNQIDESILYSSVIRLWNDSKTGNIYLEMDGATKLLIKHENVILKKIKYSVANILYFIEIQLFIYVLAFLLTNGKSFVLKKGKIESA